MASADAALAARRGNSILAMREPRLDRNEIAAELTRREILDRAARVGLAATIAAAVPSAARLAAPAPAAAQIGALTDGTLQAYFDTIIPGRLVPSLTTQLGDPIDPKAIAGVDPEPGAVEADALRLARNPRLGFEALEPLFIADLAARSVAEGAPFLDLDYEGRERVCLSGLDFANPDRVIWEAAAALPFTAFCAAASVPLRQSAKALGYRVMGHPGPAPHGYRDFSYRRRLNRGRTQKGYLP
jgi:hypothetical protein